MLVDRAEIYVRAGKGGNGCVSFRREKFIPKGGPDGGDGGDGGNVFVVATAGVDTLLDFAGRHHWIAPNGQPGMGKKMFGRKGADLTLQLPPGTLIYDRDLNILIKDLSTPGERICIAEAGGGGKGNARFARPDHQTPREAEEGTPGQERWLRLELKLIADAGIVGLPNAGKSTLLSRLSAARPKIADYPFTTLQPQLGIVQLSEHRRFVLADIPGLIDGAHEGAGLGDAFLRHIERTRVILHVVDVGSEWTAMTPAEAYRTIRAELAKYSPQLAEKEELVVANKVDLTGGREAAEALAEAIGKEVLPVSAVSGIGLGTMIEKLWTMIVAAKGASRDPFTLPSPPQGGEGFEKRPVGEGGVGDRHQASPNRAMIRPPIYDPEAPIIVIDIGNTTTSVATWHGGALKTPLAVATDNPLAFEEAYAAHVKSVPLGLPAATVISSVVPDALERIRVYVLAQQEQEALVVGETIPLPMDVGVKDKRAIGVDRVCEAAAAYDKLQSGCTIVSFGTAVTVDLVDDDGILLGGAILPGLRMQLKALHENTAALPEVQPGIPELPYGRDTTEAIQNGVCRGLTGAVRGLVEAYATYLNRWPHVVATGGDVEFLAPHCDFLDTIVSYLTLRGVGLAYDKHLAEQGA